MRRWKDIIPKMKSCMQVLWAMSIFSKYSLKKNFIIIGLIARLTILAQRGIENTDCTLHTQIPTVVHVISLRPADPNKSPLYPSVQCVRAATHRLVPNHRPLRLRQPTSWTLFSIFSPLSSIPNPALSFCSHWSFYMHYFCTGYGFPLIKCTFCCCY